MAAALHEPDEFMRRAQDAATDLGPGSIETLAGLFHSEHSPPAEIAGKFPGLGDWIAARQFAIFEMFYHMLNVNPLGCVINAKKRDSLKPQSSVLPAGGQTR